MAFGAHGVNDAVEIKSAHIWDLIGAFIRPSGLVSLDYTFLGEQDGPDGGLVRAVHKAFAHDLSIAELDMEINLSLDRFYVKLDSAEVSSKPCVILTWVWMEGVIRPEEVIHIGEIPLIEGYLERIGLSGDGAGHVIDTHIVISTLLW
jgi:hypothetical protein